jgi:peptide/nickel transport system substrate-binding protein
MKVTRKPFDDVRVRTAMKKAIDPAKVVSVVTRDLGLAGEHTHVFPGYKEYFKLPPFEQDVALAKKLLSDAGYPNGFETELVVPQTPWICPLTAQALVEQWKEIGVKVSLKIIPDAQFWDSGWPNASFSMPWWVHRSIPTMVLEVAYRSGVPWNVFEWSNKDFDQALTEAVGIIDIDKRREVVGRIEKIIQEDGPVVQPVWIPVFTFQDKRVRGFEMQPAKYIFGNELAIDQS